MSTPALSVVMPVHNAAPYLGASIESILGQTFEDLELVVLENGSTDGSAAIARHYAAADERVRVIEEPHALGVAESSNRAMASARTELIARMDADDMCHPDRLARQYEVMRDSEDVVVVGALAEGIDASGRKVRPRNRWRLVRCPEAPLPHGSAMIRRRAFEACGGYRPEMPLAADVDLFIRLSRHGRIVILPQALYSYRYQPLSVSHVTSLDEVARAKDLLHRSFVALASDRTEGDTVDPRSPGPSPPSFAIATALYYVGALRLWAGQPPGILREVIRNDSFELTPAWLRTLALAAWGSISPGTLRAALRGMIRAADLAAGARLDDGKPVEWRPG